jgi:hypothetical protein
MWLKKFVPCLRVVDSIERPLKLYCDDETVVLYAHNNKKIKAAKHINIMFYIVKEKIQNQTISLEHISTKKMIVDLLIKGKPRQESSLKQKGVSWSLCMIVRN